MGTPPREGDVIYVRVGFTCWRTTILAYLGGKVRFQPPSQKDCSSPISR